MPANQLLSCLSRICAEHRLAEKILVSPSFQIAHQIGEELAEKGGPWVNLRFVTLPSLAQEVVGVELSRRKIRLVAGTGSLFLVDKIFKKLRDGKKLDYFGGVEATTGLVRALQNSIFALRQAGLESADLEPSAFIDKRKGGEVILLLRSFEEELDAGGLIDLAGVYRLALKGIGAWRQEREAARRHREEKEMYLAFQDRPLAALERRFLEGVAGDNLVLVPQDPVFGLVRPRRLWEANTAPTPGTGLLPWLFAAKDAPRTPRPDCDQTIDIFPAIGPTNECREILRRILADKISFDEVEIIHPPETTYPSIMHALAATSDLPITLADGIPLAFTSPGKVFGGLLEWLEHNYLASDLGALIEAGALVLPSGDGGELSPLKASRYLKSAMIGWGRERYVARLRGLARDADRGSRRAVDEDNDLGKIEESGETRREIESLMAFVKDILDLLPEEDGAGKTDFAALCRGAASLLDKYAAIHGELDEEARDILAARLEEAAAFTAAPLKRQAALERLENLAAGLRVGASGPEPGRLHLSSWRSGGFSGRPVTFVVGLDQGTFPGAGIQDSILLDEERERLSAALGTSADSLRENLWAMAGMLAGLRGKIVLSYSAYDIIEERPSFPSSLILQAARLRAGDPSLDYTALAGLLPEASGFLPEVEGKGPGRTARTRAIDEIDWWLGKLAPGGRLRDGLDSVKASFDLLGRGIFAEEKRGRPKVGEFEGKIKIDPGEVDPLHNKDIVVSASRLERLAKCPFGYLLEYVLEVAPPDELELDQAHWLNALDRGSLLHEIFARFMKTLKEAGEKGGVKAAKHAPLMKRIADEVIGRYREEIPPPSEGVFEQERKDIERAVAVFLQSEEEREGRGEPLLFEVSFGCGRRRGGKDGLEEPVILDIGGGRRLSIAGRIDRVDRVGPGLYQVIDYKTGSSAKFEDVKSFGRGRALQPALYAVAAEQVLKKLGLDDAPAVVASGYYFPTRQGEGKDVMIERFDRAKFKELLRALLGALEKGHFVANPGLDARECADYCDYAPICGGTAARDRAKEKKEANPDVFEIFDKLKDYE
jgi:ATP-dependent helicase/nuclease subunit B